MVLIIVLVAVAMLSLAAYTFTELMLTEHKAARLVTRDAQARALTESAAEMARLYLGQSAQALQESGGVYSNVARFQGVQVVPVIDDGVPQNRGRFSIVAPAIENGQVAGVRFGLENESARLNVNTLLYLEQQTRAQTSTGLASAVGAAIGTTGAGPNSLGASGALGSGQRNSGLSTNATSGGQSPISGQQNGASNSSNDDSSQSTGNPRDLLMALPAMSEEIADAILDWIDADDEPREFGAEIDYYSGLGYAPKNGPLDTIEELLLVRGVSPQLLFGADANRNGIVDPSEQPHAMLAQVSDGDAEVDRGWAPYLTLYSKEANVRADGTPRIDLNNSDLQALHEQLDAALNSEWANFIVAYRQFGPSASAGGNSDQGNSGGGSRNGNGGGNRASRVEPTAGNGPFRLAALLQPQPGGAGGGGQPQPGGNGNFGGGNSPRGNPGGGQGGGRSSGGNGGGRGGGVGGVGPVGGGASQQLEEISASSIDIDFTQEAKYSFNQVLDLIGVQVRFQLPSGQGSSSSSGSSGSSNANSQTKQVLLKSPFPDEPAAAEGYLPLLMDTVTVNPALTIPGRININQASRVVLQGIPGMAGQTIDAILSNRTPEAPKDKPNRVHETWLYIEGIVDLDTMRGMTPFITGGGNVYRAQIVGYFDQMGPAHRIEAIIDASNATNAVPRIVFWRDISNLGRGFELNVLGIGPTQ
ncbi:MAG: general secretion pathway protein GspK [Pirellulales bacterium]|nr:general secretion pathway protein GspK [Pirellulales bacterium]